MFDGGLYEWVHVFGEQCFEVYVEVEVVVVVDIGDL